MRDRIENIGIALLMLLFCVITASCEKSYQNNSSVIVANSNLTETVTTKKFSDVESTEVTNEIVESIVTSGTTITTAITESVTSTRIVTTDEKLAEKQLIKDILMLNDPYCTEEQAEEEAAWAVDNAKPFSEFTLGNIDSEEDAKQKGRTILIKLKGQKFIENIESDFFVYDGKKVKLIRDNPPYFVNYYEKYDAWIIKAVLRSGKLEDGGDIATPGTSPYVILRGTDGKVLAVY